MSAFLKNRKRLLISFQNTVSASDHYSTKALLFPNTLTQQLNSSLHTNTYG